MLDRRRFLTAGVVAGTFACAPVRALAPVLRSATEPQTDADPRIVAAKAALERHAGAIAHRDLVGIADFSQPSRKERFYLVDLLNGRTRTLLVSHGSGSDPQHSGWLKRFSNEPNSNASSAGAYLTGAEYVGKHGRSMRLAGLEPSNSNAEPRAIVVHGAWYVSPEMAAQHGKIGRSQGCFAFDEAELAGVLEQLGPGRLLLAGKF